MKTVEELSAITKHAVATRNINQLAAKRSEAAHKSWITRHNRAKMLSARAHKAWRTRRAIAVAK